MKSLIINLSILLISIEAWGQHVSNIRFIHRGEELKPVGTLSIGIDKIIPPKDRSFDYLYGKGIKTDTESLKIVSNFMSNNKQLTDKPRTLHNNREFYEIIIVSDKTTKNLYLGQRNIKSFFDDLKGLLVKNKADQKLIDILQYY